MSGGQYAELHIVAHGAPGVLYLGGQQLTAYHVAAGAAGEDLLDMLSALTGRRAVGTPELVGAGNAESFDFAMPTGVLSPFSTVARMAYSATLAPPQFFLSAIELSDVEAGTGGFVINGVTDGDRSGYSVSFVGDVDGDGVDDVIIGADGSDENGSRSGSSFVVFGKPDGIAVELSDVAAGSGGFAIHGASTDDSSGKAVSSAGDVNGDGLNDLIVGAKGSDPNGPGSGASYVMFGKSDGAAVELSDIENGTGGFVVNDTTDLDAAGRSVSTAGDVNGDNLADLIIGADGASPSAGESGAGYVVFGKTDSSSVELSDVNLGSGGFSINGASAYDHAGISVSTAGDVNGDGLDDVIVGAWSDDSNGNYSDAGFVVFGKSDGTTVDLSTVDLGTGGFAINGTTDFNLAGWSVSDAGDVNGDGLDDLIVGAFGSGPNSIGSGASFVVFGKTDGNAVELSDIEAGVGGIVINGVASDDLTGVGVGGGGDINGDGLSDLIVGAVGDQPNGVLSGASSVVFGKGAIDLVTASDTGASDMDNVTGDRTPTIAFTTEAGVTVEIDWDDGNGFVAAAPGTGALQQETLATPYLSNGAKTIQVRATNGLAESTVETLAIQITSIATPGDDLIDLSFSTIDENISALAGNDTVLTGTGNDMIFGDEDNDILVGGAGGDLLDGGSGTDRASYINATAGVLADIAFIGSNSGDAAGDTFVSIEDLEGSAHDDDLRGDNNDNTILGGDRITFRFGDDIATGGTESDRFILDGRKVLDGEAYTITDLNFGEGDRLEFRFMDAGTFDDSIDLTNSLTVQAGGFYSIFTPVEDILETDGNGVITGASDGFGGTILTGMVGANTFTLTLDGIDIFPGLA